MFYSGTIISNAGIDYRIGTCLTNFFNFISTIGALFLLGSKISLFSCFLRIRKKDHTVDIMLCNGCSAHCFGYKLLLCTRSWKLNSRICLPSVNSNLCCAFWVLTWSHHLALHVWNHAIKSTHYWSLLELVLHTIFRSCYFLFSLVLERCILHSSWSYLYSCKHSFIYTA